MRASFARDFRLSTDADAGISMMPASEKRPTRRLLDFSCSDASPNYYILSRHFLSFRLQRPIYINVNITSMKIITRQAFATTRAHATTAMPMLLERFLIGHFTRR